MIWLFSYKAWCSPFDSQYASCTSVMIIPSFVTVIILCLKAHVACAYSCYLNVQYCIAQSKVSVSIRSGGWPVCCILRVDISVWMTMFCYHLNSWSCVHKKCSGLSTLHHEYFRTFWTDLYSSVPFWTVAHHSCYHITPAIHVDNLTHFTNIVQCPSFMTLI